MDSLNNGTMEIDAELKARAEAKSASSTVRAPPEPLVRSLAVSTTPVYEVTLKRLSALQRGGVPSSFLNKWRACNQALDPYATANANPDDDLVDDAGGNGNAEDAEGSEADEGGDSEEEGEEGDEQEEN